MRIIGGELRRRQIKSPPETATTRPIPDRVKEAVFNLLRGHFEGVSVLDVFSGTGTIGLEAVSRGADRVVFVERDRRVTRILQENIDTLDVGDRCEIVNADALGPATIARCPKPVHIAFFDPPYAMVRDPEDWPRARKQFERIVSCLTDTGYAVLRTPWPFVHEFPDHDGGPGAVRREDVSLELDGAVGPETHVYKNTAVHLYMKRQDDSTRDAGG